MKGSNRDLLLEMLNLVTAWAQKCVHPTWLKLRQNTNGLNLIILSKPLRDDEQLSGTQFSTLYIRNRDIAARGERPQKGSQFSKTHFSY